MEKKYQLVAWTKNITDTQKARLYMIPSMEWEIEALLIADLANIHKEEYKSHGHISHNLARKAIRAYENMSKFQVLTGHYAKGVRYLLYATKYCICKDEATRLRKEAMALAKRHRCEYVLYFQE